MNMEEAKETIHQERKKEMQSKKKNSRIMLPRTWPLALALVATLVLAGNSALAATAQEIDRDATAALQALYANTPGAKDLGNQARGVLIFPNIVKGGFLFAAQFGDGALRQGGNTVGYYRSLAASYGFQAGIESFGYVLFFMDDASLQYLNNSDGWELGTGPTLVVLDQGFARNFSTTTLQSGVYAFIFDQKGLMGGVGIQGSKITKINPDN
jgi:lipid-binding SYLF domain-containing protein